MGKISCVIILLFLILAKTMVFSAEREIVLTSPVGKNTPISNYILCINQDSLGVMWIGTNEGVCKYDGRKTQLIDFKEDYRDKRETRSLFVDLDGDMWIGRQGKLYLHHYKTDLMSEVSLTSLNKDISSIYQQSDSIFWLGNTEGGVIRYNKVSGRSTNYELPEKDRISSLHAVNDSTLFVGLHNSGIYYFNIPTGKYQAMNESLLKGDKTVRAGISTANHGYLFCSNKAIYCLKDNAITFCSFLGKDQETKLPYRVTSVEQVSDSTFWIGTDGSGILSYNIDQNKIEILTLNYERPVEAITSLYKSKDKIVWIGTTNNGLLQYNPLKTEFVHWGYEKGGVWGLGNSAVLHIAPLNGNRLLVALDGSGLDIYNRETNHFDHLSEKQLNFGIIRCTYQSLDGKLWFGTYSKGLKCCRINERNKMTPVDIPFSFDSGPTINVLYEDKAGNLWIGTGTKGAFMYNPQSNHIRSFSPSGEEEKISSDLITVFAEDSDGNIWIGGYHGLDKYIVEEDRLQPITLCEWDGAPIYITSITEGKDGNIWIASKKGLWRILKSGQESFLYTEKDGLPDASVNAICADDFGDFWITTDHGIALFNPETNNFRVFNIDDGVEGIQNPGAILKVDDGKIFFGGTNGLYAVNPSHVKTNPFKPEVILEDMKILSDLSNKRNGNPTINLHGQDNVVLSHKESTFSIDFVAVNYTLPEKNRYVYQLQGYDSDKITKVDGGRVRYTNVPPGTYQFNVTASNNDGVLNKEGKTLTIVINPPWYMTYWALAIWIVLAVLVILLLNRYILLQARLKDELKMERLEKEKQNEIVQNKLRFFTNITHELRSPLTLIFGPLEKLLKEEQQGTVGYKSLFQIKNSANRLLRLINQILEFRKAEQGMSQLKVSRCDFVWLTSEICNSFRELAEDKQVDLIVYAPEKLEVWIDQSMVEIILINLLSNAFRYTPRKGRIDVSIRINDVEKTVVLTVKDSGRGILEKDLPNIFDRFYQADEDHQGGTGIGLALTKRLVELHHGMISVESVYGEGATFSVIFLQGKEQFNADQLVETDKNCLRSAVVIEEDVNLVPALVEARRNNEKIQTVLYVEDEPELQSFVTAELSNLFHVEVASDGKEGYEKAIKLNPDLIISDVMMPNMTGWELCEKVKKNFDTSHIPVILLTALGSESHQLQGLEIGADDYIAKPFGVQALCLKACNLLETRQRLVSRFTSKDALKVEVGEFESPDEEFLNKATQIIQDNVGDQQFRIERLIQELGISRTLFFKKIKALTGLAPSDFIRTVRLKYAAELLIKSPKNISEVAFDTGFASPKHFREHFKKQFGVTPSVYIQENKS
ncbi:response regulator [Puteibacter caeruleilacunae]|nr:response regulator [Puteibacter caeruleilacunae]